MKCRIEFNDGRVVDCPQVALTIADLLEAHPSGLAFDGNGNKVDRSTRDKDYEINNDLVAVMFENKEDAEGRLEKNAFAIIRGFND